MTGGFDYQVVVVSIGCQGCIISYLLILSVFRQNYLCLKVHLHQHQSTSDSVDMSFLTVLRPPSSKIFGNKDKDMI